MRGEQEFLFTWSVVCLVVILEEGTATYERCVFNKTLPQLCILLDLVVGFFKGGAASPEFKDVLE